MFVNVLPKDTGAVLELLTSHHIVDSFYMAGGTAAALQLGHRISYDFDFFSPQEFDTTLLIQRLSSIGKFDLAREAWGTVHGLLNDVRVSFMFYKYPLLFPAMDFKGIGLADHRDIALMKMTAVSSRGAKKDFIDLYVVCRKTISLDALLDLFKEKYSAAGYSTYHLLRSLAYFDDAERDVDPVILADVSWHEVKTYFREQQSKLLARYEMSPDLPG